MTAFKKRVLDKIAQKRNYTDWEELKKDYTECGEDYRCPLIVETANITLAEVEKEIDKTIVDFVLNNLYTEINRKTILLQAQKLKNHLRGKEQ